MKLIVMCVVYVVVLTVGLAVQILAAADCQNGTIRFDPNSRLNQGPHAGYVQLCKNDKWNRLCGNFFRVEASVICRQLGYSEYGSTRGSDQDRILVYDSFMLARCDGGERSVMGCDVIARLNCYQNWIKCRPANCTDGSLRLVGGASYREGRVEVCVGGRWGTVCYNEELTGTICTQLGFGGKGATTIRTHTSGSEVNCATNRIGLSCDHFTPQERCPSGGLAVQCQACNEKNNCPTTDCMGTNTNMRSTTMPTAYETTYDYSTNTSPDSSATEVSPDTTTMEPNKNEPRTSYFSTDMPITNEPTTNNNSTSNYSEQVIHRQTIALGAIIGVLTLAEFFTIIGCILCFARKKWHTKIPPPQQKRGITPISYRRVKPNLTLDLDCTKETHSIAPADYETMVLGNGASNDYETMAIEGVIEGHETIETNNEAIEGYETMVSDEGAAIDGYCVVDHNISLKITSDHPPPVGGVSEDNDADYV